MKKAISLMLILVMLLTSFFVIPAYGATKTYAEDALKNVQTISGYIPGKTSSVQGNCYGFISAVCEKLYGVGYNGEGLYGNYKCKHSSGNFYTVATYENKSTSMSQETATAIKDYFVNNAMPGDIIHYGTITGDSSNSATHTFMIQSVDSKKMRIYHSNYEIAGNSRATCHIDDIVWSSFLESPTKTEYNNDGSLYSLNAIFYNKMKKNGLGITINRYSKYTDMFYSVGVSVPTVSLKRASSTSILVSWTAVPGATKYELKTKVTSDASYTVYNGSLKTTSCTVTGLKMGTKYSFKVKAYVNGAWKDYSTPVTMVALPPNVTCLTAEPTVNGMVLNWKPSKDADGYYIYRNDVKVATLKDSTLTSWTDKKVADSVSYTYYISPYKSSYSNKSSTATAVYEIPKPQVSASHSATCALRFNFVGNDMTTSFVYAVTDSEDNIIASGETQENSITVKGLEIGEAYTCNVAGKNSVTQGEYESCTKKAIPPTPSTVDVSLSSKGILVSSALRSDVDGYYIYRSTSSTGSFTRIADVSQASSSNLAYDTSFKPSTKYYYAVSRYVIKDGKRYEGSKKVSNAITYKVATVTNLKAKSVSNASIQLSWTKEPISTKYVVYYREAGTSSFKSVIVSTNTVTIKSLALGKVYDFKVCGKNNFATGSCCAIVSKKVIPPTMVAPKLTKATTSVKVAWTSSPYATGYKIYRKTSSTGTATLVKTVTKNTTLSFVDKNVSKGKTYYYSVVAYKTYQGKEYSSAKSTYSSIKF